MCKIEERVYFAADGSRRRIEDPFYCEKGRPGRFCGQVSRRTTNYYPDQPPLRDDAPSPASLNPPTPPVAYRVQEIEPLPKERPTSATRDGATRAIKPQITIQIGKRPKEKKYPVTTPHRYSFGARSIASSNEVNIDSPGSASPIRTGFPETNPPPTGYPGTAYHTMTVMPGTTHHRHTSSASSYTTSHASQPPSLYATSDPDSPSTRRHSRRLDNTPVQVHNGPPPRASSPSRARPTSSGRNYRIVTPGNSNDSLTHDGGLFPLDYQNIRVPSNSSNPSPQRDRERERDNRATEIIDRGLDRDRIRRQNSEAQKRRRQEEDRIQQAETRRQQAEDRRLAEKLQAEELARQQEEDARQARIERERYNFRAKERAENQTAQAEKRRAEEREIAREQTRRAREEEDLRRAREEAEFHERLVREKEKERVKEKEKREKAAKKERNRLDEEIQRRKKQSQNDSTHSSDSKRSSTKEKERLPTREKVTQTTSKPVPQTTTTGRPRRLSTSTETSLRERELLLAETEAQMQREREATQHREAAERAAFLYQQQLSQQYYDPRRSDQNPIPNPPPGLGRRNSVSERRNSVSARRQSLSAPPPSIPVVQPPPQPQNPVSGMGGRARRVSIHQDIRPVITPLVGGPGSLNSSNGSVDTTNYSMRDPSMRGPGLYPSSTNSATQPPAPRAYAPPPAKHHAVFDEPYQTYSQAYAPPAPQPSARRGDPPVVVPSRPTGRRLSISGGQGLGQEEAKTLRRRGEQVIEMAGERVRGERRKVRGERERSIDAGIGSSEDEENWGRRRR